MIELLHQLCAIASPTRQEQEIVKFLKEYAQEYIPEASVKEHLDSLIFEFPKTDGLPHISLVGHSDVVPAHFEPYVEDDKFHGSGASDMKAALASFLEILKNHRQNILDHYNLSLIIYSREEGTPMKENGLYDLIAEYPDYFKSIDLAIVGEPTDNTIQIGCVGSIHAEVTILGQACHSARPWNGKNALYEASAFIQKMSELEPVKHPVFGVDFFDVMQITESQTEPGRTTLPGYWKANVNYRFAPIRNEEEAWKHLETTFLAMGLKNENFRLKDSSSSGQVIENDVFKSFMKKLDAPIQAKQAWTDVAQLTALGISAFNYGPGLTAQAHQDNEYTSIQALQDYTNSLTLALKGK